MDWIRADRSAWSCDHASPRAATPLAPVPEQEIRSPLPLHATPLTRRETIVSSLLAKPIQ